MCVCVCVCVRERERERERETEKFVYNMFRLKCTAYQKVLRIIIALNTLRTGDADLRLYITTVQDG